MLSLLFFCLDAKEKVTKEKIKAALLGLLRYFSPLKKRTRLRSNSFFFLTLRKAPPLHAQKVRPIFDTTSLRSLEWMFSDTLQSPLFPICYPERSEGFWVHSHFVLPRSLLPLVVWMTLLLERSTFYTPSKNIHLNEQSDVESQWDRPLVEEREEFFALSREEEKAVWA